MDIQKEAVNSIKEATIKILSVKGTDITLDQLIEMLQADYWYLQCDFIAHVASNTYVCYKRSTFYTQESFYFLMEDNFSQDSIFALYCFNLLEGTETLTGSDEDIMDLLSNEDLLVLHRPSFEDVRARYYKRYGFSI